MIEAKEKPPCVSGRAVFLVKRRGEEAGYPREYRIESPRSKEKPHASIGLYEALTFDKL